MIGSVSSSTMMPQQMSGGKGASNTSSLTTSQQETISSVLSQYDASNLSESDAQSIVEAFKAAGIQPGQALEEAMSAEGFDAKEVGSLAGVGGRHGGGNMPPPPPPSEEEVNSISSLLDTLLNMSEEEEDETTATTTTSEYDNSSFEEIMEYTSRILSLNETSKTDVMNMLQNLSSQDSSLTEEETADIVKNSLTQILSDSSNYNRVSMYA